MSTPRERFWDNITAIVSVLVLGAGFVALFAGFDYFFLIWILGWIVVVPIIAILFDDDEDDRSLQELFHTIDELRSDVEIPGRPKTSQRERTRTRHRTRQSKRENTGQSTSTQDALSTLRERYASGDLTDTQFEQKLDRLLETETPEDATEWRERTRREIETERSE